MLAGEAKELFSERTERWTPKISRKKYLFQIRNDDGRDHFTEISRRFKSLWFVLVYDGAGGGQWGSYLIRQGRCRSYSRVEDDWDDEDDWRFWEANWETPNGKYD